MAEKAETGHSKEVLAEADIYIMEHSEDYVKIGYSKHPKHRLKSINSNCPHCDVKLEAVFEIPEHIDTSVVESELHDSLKGWKYQGEWFEIPTQEAVDRVSTLIADIKDDPDGAVIQDEGEEVSEIDILYGIAHFDDCPTKTELSNHLEITRSEFKTLVGNLESERVVFSSIRKDGTTGRPPRVYDFDDWVATIYEKKPELESMPEAAIYAYENDIDKDLVTR